MRKSSCPAARCARTVAANTHLHRNSFEETPTGARVVITTADKESLIAVHKFLRFQIDEHKTGDPTVDP
jgi:hypothetical protein